MTSESLTSILVEKVLEWRVCPDRFMTGHREWIRRERFQPTSSIDAALRLLIAAKPTEYLLGGDLSGTSWAKVTLNGSSGEGVSQSLPTAICIAIGRALGIHVEAVD
jgi:hypothetical protein